MSYQMSIFDISVASTYSHCPGEYVDEKCKGRKLKFDDMRSLVGCLALLECRFGNQVKYKVIYIKDIINFYGEDRLIYSDGYADEANIPKIFMDEKQPYHHKIYELMEKSED